MSASEKLKELDEHIMHRYLRDGGGPLATLSLALPQIVAVVEAVETYYPLMAKHYDPQDEAEVWWPQLHAALAALEKALS